ncbi:hypothetical protein GOACH_05_00610 [Gordonia aichiensis NBRC 108223]|uniref:Uncharacterized protein n=1 Tax=Gordonia aichiensis NBRC 108223 TaxID=1220583 RepID=L7KKE9_9ACTN|nr:hypothetical protein GOACH_05_00610 [Gordonia aichiensis NBRC 108223]
MVDAELIENLDRSCLDRTTVDALQAAGAFENGQIAPHRLARHVEPVGQRGHGGAAMRAYLIRYCPLSLFGVHLSSPICGVALTSGVSTVSFCWFEC